MATFPVDTFPVKPYMLHRSVRLFDNTAKRMLYPRDLMRLNIVLSSEGLPLQVHDGQFKILAECVPMWGTGLLSGTKQPIWEGDILDCDLQHDLGGFVTMTRERGVMTWEPLDGKWTLLLPKSATQRSEFRVTNTIIIGNVWEHPDLKPSFK